VHEYVESIESDKELIKFFFQGPEVRHGRMATSSADSMAEGMPFGSATLHSFDHDL
jgi:hypothetical protein